MPSKIESQLTPEEVVDFLEELAGTEGGQRLATIQTLAQKRGVKVSLMGATSFRDGALEPYLAKLSAAREKSQQIAQQLLGGEEEGALSGSRLLLAEQIMDFLGTGEVQPKQFGNLAKALGTLSGASQQERMTVARLRELEAKEEERKRERAKLEERAEKLNEKGGITRETRDLIEELIGLL